MGSKGRKNNRSKTLRLLRSKSVTVQANVKTVDINGTIYYTCRNCNKLQDRKLAADHFQKCKPRIYSLANDKIYNKHNEIEYKDPYEIIPEEMDLEDQMTNNNTMVHNRNNSGRRCKLQVSVPKKLKKNDTKTLGNNNLMEVNEVSSITQKVDDSPRKTRKGGKVSIAKQSIDSNKQIGKCKRNSRRLTEQSIEDRLKKISEKLKMQKKKEIPNDDEEEEERKAIEERLSALNKDSEISIFQEGDIDDNLKEEDSMSIGAEGDLVLRSLQNGDGQVQCYTELPGSDEKLKNAINEFEQSSLLNSPKNVEIVVISQKPDGQLHTCKKCTEVFVTAMDLLRHSRMKHTYPKIVMAPSEIEKLLKLEDRSACPICKKPLVPPYKSVYEKHLQTHSWVAEHQCSICKKKFKRRDHMKVHEKRHIV